MIGRINLKNGIICCLSLVLLVVFRFFNLIQLSNRYYWARLGYLLAVIVFILYLPGVIRTFREYRFLAFELLYICLAQTIICVYSMNKYDQGAMDMLNCAGTYLYILLAPIIILTIRIDGHEALFKTMVFLETCYDIVLLSCAVVKNYLGIVLIYLPVANSKTGNLRVSAGVLCPLVTIYLLYKLLAKENKKKTFLLLCINLITIFYVDQTRVKEIAIIISAIAMILYYMKTVRRKIYPILLVVLGICVVFRLGIHTDIINSFSIDPRVNPNYTSSLARIRAIAYFKSFTDENILIGQGWINPRSVYLRNIFSGPNNTYFFDDLGVLGHFYRMGLLGLSFWVLFLARVVFLFFKVKDNKNMRTILLGIILYIGVSAVSLNIFDGQRIMLVPFIMAISEYFVFSFRSMKRCN